MALSISRRNLLGAAAGMAAFPLVGLERAYAQYPERGLMLIVPYGAGGGSSTTMSGR